MNKVYLFIQFISGIFCLWFINLIAINHGIESVGQLLKELYFIDGILQTKILLQYTREVE